LARQREVTAQADRLVEISRPATSMAAILERLRGGLEQASFEQRRQLIELLIDRVVVTNGAVEIRYVIPTTEDGTRTPRVTCGLTTSIRFLMRWLIA
jgi:site-specific DNA recombinase